VLDPTTLAGLPSEFPLNRYLGRPSDSVWQIDQSQLLIKVYRTGRLKRLGHNHILSSNQLQGLIYWPTLNAPSNAFADLLLAVHSLAVDNPDLRAKAGDAFLSKPSESDRTGTRRNMLSAKVLNGAEFLTASANQPGQPSQWAQAQIRIKDRKVEQVLPLTLSGVENESGVQLQVSSQFTLSHQQLGLTPFSALAGALRVADELQFELQLVAVPHHPGQDSD